MNIYILLGNNNAGRLDNQADRLDDQADRFDDQDDPLDDHRGGYLLERPDKLTGKSNGNVEQLNGKTKVTPPLRVWKSKQRKFKVIPLIWCYSELKH